jgi:predicted ATPase
LRQLEALLVEAAGGHGRLVLLGGEAGVGKTALVAELCRHVVRTTRILEGGCDALSTPRPLGPLADIALTVGGDLERQLATDGRRDGAFAALIGELSRQAQPTLLVIEDVHWADEATLDLLRFLGHRHVSRR